MSDCRTCKYAGNNSGDRCRGCWKNGAWQNWEAADLDDKIEKGFEAGWNIGYMKGLEDGKEMAKPKWIPVTEELPVNVTRGYSDCVLTVKDDVTQIGRYDHVMAEWRTRDYQYLGHVSAWMPLPEPYKPKEETP